MAKLMNQQNPQQRCRESPSTQQHAGMLAKPLPGPEIAIRDHGLQSVHKILHEPRTIGSSGNRSGSQQEQGKTVVPES
jgi:hypothetical protein